MPFGAVFTSGDLGGGRKFTRMAGPLLLGYSTADPGGQTLDSTGAHSGTASQPLLSFYNRPDTGLFASNVTTSASEVRWSQIGTAVTFWSTAGCYVGTTSFQSTGGVSQAFYIPQSTGALMTSSGGGTAPATLSLGAAIVFDAGRNKLCVFSTVANAWLGTAPLTSS